AAKPARILNGLKVVFGYWLSKALQKPIHFGMPVAISIEPTTSCNLRCPQCPSGLRSFSRPIGMLQGDLYKKVIDDLHPTLTYLILYFQGEPYLNKGFLDMVSYAASKKLYTATSTNAHYLNDENARKTVESGLDRLIISIDGLTQDTYGKYRVGGHLEKVLSGTANLVKWKKELKSSTPHIIWQFIVFKHNEHELPAMRKLAEEAGVDVLGVKTAQIYDYANGSDLLPEGEEFRRYNESEEGFSIKNKLLNHCWKLWHSCVITWDGRVVPCCFDKDATHQLGFLGNNSFKEIWNGEPYKAFRTQVIKGRKHIDICKNCSEGTTIWAGS
ncbi:MAG: SPASM domain-containing protein, partial [Bacteroidia bacterium]|nr:SPASM domain-containing protein [Bacteroidia bacterium]